MKLDSRFLARKEQILALYALPYDAAFPVVCYDERPCFLIGDQIEPVAMQTGQIRKEHFAYKNMSRAKSISRTSVTLETTG